MIITSEKGRYEVGKLVGKAEAYHLYVCQRDGSDQEYLLQIATELIHGGALERTALFLKTLNDKANELEELYATTKEKPEEMLNYGLGFPELVESFICPEQGSRRVNILAFRNVKQVSRMVPISNIINKDRQRVDLRTSAWIMGKALKLLAFFHSNGFAIGLVNAANILIEPDQHYVLFFDWSKAVNHEGAVNKEMAGEEIAEAARAVVALLGGDWEKGEIAVWEDETKENFDPNLKYDEELYIEFVLELARGMHTSAEKAHEEFYEIVDRLWAREFYPFTSFDRI
ncbi:hypothetical protein A2482_03885 [Candidatus Falkowbacteria bacterium RIFOXYC2_FULL_48_21]|uniref:Protein kinase domain-containing protein n=1 Tax=Candidatus Falkowbacteria bacterium RIFOXYC2_FULL_48_21 TaxID=1798005 RepID=A0A1F5T7W7_9BACT|nr:MAG: hypothetical protein A2482_03885 [Candidatus Falkowbacteria bacterium RIFOXYC2_FULL_48_21]